MIFLPVNLIFGIFFFLWKELFRSGYSEFRWKVFEFKYRNIGDQTDVWIVGCVGEIECVQCIVGGRGGVAEIKFNQSYQTNAIFLLAGDIEGRNCGGDKTKGSKSFFSTIVLITRSHGNVGTNEASLISPRSHGLIVSFKRSRDDARRSFSSTLFK